MKKIYLILLFLIGFFDTFSQPIVPRGTVSQTVSDQRLMVPLNLFIPRYSDTTAANLQKGIDSCGAVIFTYVGNLIWKRSCNPKKWEVIGTGTVTSVSQGYGIINSPNPIVGIGSVTLDSSTVYTKVRNMIGDSVQEMPDQLIVERTLQDTTGSFNKTNGASIIELDNDSLISVAIVFTGATSDDAQTDIYKWYSPDNGKTWGLGTVAVLHSGINYPQTPSLYRKSNGDLLMVGLLTQGVDSNWIVKWTSTDKGVTWSSHTRILLTGRLFGPMSDRLFKYGNRLYYPYGANSGDGFPYGKLMYSDNEGTTWDTTTWRIIAPDNKVSEPGIYHAFTRNGNDRLVFYWRDISSSTIYARILSPDGEELLEQINTGIKSLDATVTIKQVGNEKLWIAIHNPFADTVGLARRRAFSLSQSWDGYYFAQGNILLRDSNTLYYEPSINFIKNKWLLSTYSTTDESLVEDPAPKFPLKYFLVPAGRLSFNGNIGQMPDNIIDVDAEVELNAGKLEYTNNGTSIYKIDTLHVQFVKPLTFAPNNTDNYYSGNNEDLQFFSPFASSYNNILMRHSYQDGGGDYGNWINFEKTNNNSFDVPGQVSGSISFQQGTGILMGRMSSLYYPTSSTSLVDLVYRSPSSASITGTDKFSITSEGIGYFEKRLGINKTAPIQALHVNGQVQIDTITTGGSSDSVLVVNGGLVKKVLQSSIAGSTPGIDDVLAVGQSLSANRSVTAGANTLTHTFNSITANGFTITSNSTAAVTTTQALLDVQLSGANASSTILSKAINGINTHTGTNSTNYGVFGQASGGSFNYGVVGDGGIGVLGTGTFYGVSGSSGTANSRGGLFSNSATTGTNYGLESTSTGTGTTNIGGLFAATNATNNYAIIVPSSSGRIGFGTSTPVVSALLDLTSTTQGLLPPRMTAAQRIAISSPATGLEVFDTDSARYMVYNGSTWKGIAWTDVGGGSSTSNYYFRNTGATGDGWAVAIDDSTVGFKKIIAGANITVTPADSSITVASSLSGTGLVSFSGTTPSYNTTSASIAGIISDEVGTAGGLVFSGSPTLVTPTFTTSATTPLLIGGTGPTSTLTLQSTSGSGTTGSDIIFQDDNTEWMRILNNGNVGIGNASPASLFTVGIGDLFQINSAGQIGGQQAPQSDYWLSAAGTTSLDYSRMIDVSNSNDVNEDSRNISNALTQNIGTFASGSRTIDAYYQSLTPTAVMATSSGVNTLNLNGQNTTMDLSGVSFGTSAGSSTRVFPIGFASNIFGTINVSDPNTTGSNTFQAIGIQSQILTNAVVSSNSDNYNYIVTGYYINNGAQATTDANTTATMNGATIAVNGSLTTTGTTTHNGITLTVAGSADNNNGLSIDVTAATSNVALAITNPSAASGNYAINSTATAQSSIMGLLGVGVSVPTAWLHTAASTTTAASLRIPTGTAPTSPNEGDIWQNSNNFLAFTNSTTYTLAKTLTNTATLDFGNTAAGSSTDLTITVTGAAVGDIVLIGVPNGSVPDNGTFFGWVSATDTISIRYSNNDLSNAKDPASGTYRVSIVKY